MECDSNQSQLNLFSLICEKSRYLIEKKKSHLSENPAVGMDLSRDIVNVRPPNVYRRARFTDTGRTTTGTMISVRRAKLTVSLGRPNHSTNGRFFLNHPSFCEYYKQQGLFK